MMPSCKLSSFCAHRLLLLALACPPASVQAQSGASPVYRIAGTVVNALSGEPVRGATVSVLTQQDSRDVGQTQTGSDGQFSVDGLPAAKYQLTASKRGYSTAAYDEHGDFSSAIVTGDDPNSNFDTTHVIFRLSPGATLRGVVSADGSDPVADAEVRLFRKPEGHAPGEKIVQQDTAITDDTGAYEFSNLAPGEYLLAVKARPWYAMHGDQPTPGQTAFSPPNPALDVAYAITYFDSTTDQASASPIVLGQGSRIEADINLHAVPALHLHVESSNGRSSDSRRPMLSQMIFGEEVRTGNPGMRIDGQSGAVDLIGVAPGQYELSHGDPARVVEVDAGASQEIESGSGAPAFTVNGALVTADGKPVTTGAVVTLEPADPGQGFKPPESNYVNGAFQFVFVPVGTYMLHTEVDGLPESVLSVSVAGQDHSGNRFTVRDRPVTLLVHVTAGGASVEGFARKDGKGVSGVMVLLVPLAPSALPEGIRRDQSDSDGSFSLHDAAPGGYTIIAIQEGWNLEWTRPAVLARYLPAGIPVTVTAAPENVVRVPEPVPVQGP